MRSRTPSSHQVCLPEVSLLQNKPTHLSPCSGLCHPVSLRRQRPGKSLCQREESGVGGLVSHISVLDGQYRNSMEPTQKMHEVGIN